MNNRFTGIFTEFGRVQERAHDPAVSIYSGKIPPWGLRHEAFAVGGAGWTPEAAAGATVGEGVERLQPYPLSRDEIVTSSFNAWPRDEAAVVPGEWVLFDEAQYTSANFPFQKFTRDTVCRWVCFRDSATGAPRWVPDEFAFLYLTGHARNRIVPGMSTGLACGRAGDPVLLRGLQEVIERDAMIGAWWGAYALEEWDADAVLELLEDGIAEKIFRPNLSYRFYRVDSPYSANATLVTIEGEDREGFCFSVGSACRESLARSFEKSILESVHSRHFVRYLRTQPECENLKRHKTPTSFPEHALYYSLFPEDLRKTVLHRAKKATQESLGADESLDVLRARLLPHPVLFRIMTPPGLAFAEPGWRVMKVLVPGLTPLHGNHLWPHCGSKLWQQARADSTLPHPFP